MENTDIFLVEFRPDARDPLGRLVQDVTGRPYAHTGMVVGDKFYELDGRIKGATMRYAYEGMQDLQVMRGRKQGANDSLEFYALPPADNAEEAERRLRAVEASWEAAVAAQEPFGWWNMISFAFKIPYRRLSTWVFDRWGWRWPGVASVFHSHWLCCSAACCRHLRAGGVDLFPGERDEDIYPGRFADVLRRAG